MIHKIELLTVIIAFANPGTLIVVQTYVALATDRVRLAQEQQIKIALHVVALITVNH
jgi:hypothetical protein